MATNMFWHLCERDFQQLVQNCEATDEAKKQRQRLRRQFANYQHESFDCFCPSQTARQIDSWARNRPSIYSYVFQVVSCCCIVLTYLLCNCIILNNRNMYNYLLQYVILNKYYNHIISYNM